MSQEFVCLPMERLCIHAQGADASAYLHSQLSNDIASLVDGQSCYSFVLEPTGKIIVLLRVTRLNSESFLLDTDAVAGLEEQLISRLNKFKIRVKVDFTAEIRRCAALRASGDGVLPDSVRTAALGVPSGIVVDAWWGSGNALDVLPVESGRDVLCADVVEACADLEYIEDEQALEVFRVRSGWPAMNNEIVPGETLVAATGVVVRAVSFTKGCYPGQELVERMDSRGASAPRSLRRIARHEVPCSDPRSMVVGDALVVDGAEVGRITSIAGDWVLAHVARTVDVGEPVTPAN